MLESDRICKDLHRLQELVHPIFEWNQCQFSAKIPHPYHYDGHKSFSTNAAHSHTTPKHFLTNCAFHRTNTLFDF